MHGFTDRLVRAVCMHLPQRGFQVWVQLEALLWQLGEHR